MSSNGQQQEGLLVVISAPSGGGKTTVIRALLDHFPYAYSVSATTRPERKGEIDGKDYHFLSIPDFERLRAEGGFVEWAEVHGNFYGTPRAQIDAVIAEGRIILLDIDVQGGIAVKKDYGDRAFLVFIEPPSMADLESRLRGRSTDSNEVIERRLKAVPFEMAEARHYDRRVVNHDIDQTINTVQELIQERLHQPSSRSL